MTVTLPGGAIKFMYNEWAEGRSFRPSDNPAGVFGQFNPPPELSVTLTAPGGEVIEVKAPRSPPGGITGGLSVSRGMKISPTYWRCTMGKVKIATPGDYALRAEPAIPRRGEPSILIGPG
jgi:hypothetical protein